MLKKELEIENDKLCGLLADQIVETEELNNAIKEIQKRSSYIMSKDPNKDRDTLFMVKIEEICNKVLEG